MESRRSFRIEELSHPYNLITARSAVADFAAVAHQAKWRLGSTRSDDFDTLSECWNLLGDLALLDGTAEEVVGMWLRNDDEAAAMNRLSDSLESVTAKLGQTASASECFDDLLWPDVVAAAQAAQRTFLNGDPVPVPDLGLQDREVRFEALRAYGARMYPFSDDPVLTCLLHENTSVVTAALEILEGDTREEVGRMVRPLLSDRNWNLAQQANRTYAPFYSNEELRRALNHPNHDVQFGAMDAVRVGRRFELLPDVEARKGDSYVGGAALRVWLELSIIKLKQDLGRD